MLEVVITEGGGAVPAGMSIGGVSPGSPPSGGVDLNLKSTKLYNKSPYS